MERTKAAREPSRAGAMLAGLGGALALAGCMSAAPEPTATAPVVAPAAAPVVVDVPLPPHPPRKPAPPTLADVPQDSAPPEASSPEASSSEAGNPDAGSTTDLGFAKLTGLDENQTVAILGQPQQRADSPPAVLWRYASHVCELDVYFYLDLQSRDMRILHYEVKDTDGSDRSQQDCYAELVAARRTE